MQNLKKVSFTALVGVLILLLAACSSGQNTPAANNNSPQTTLVIITSTPRDTATPTVTPTPVIPMLPASELAGIQLDLWYLWPTGQTDTLGDLIDSFNRGNEYDLEIIPHSFSHPDDFQTALADAVISSSPPDIVLAHPYLYNTWAEAELLVDLTPYLESNTYGNPTFTEDFYPVFVERDRYNEQRWGFPGLFNGQVMLYNQTWAGELGYSQTPTSTAAFQMQACTSVEANGGYTGGWMIDNTQGGAAAWLLAFAGTLEKSGQYRFEAGEVQEALTFLAGVSGEGCAWQPNDPYPDQNFIDRQGLFYPVNTREITYVTQAFEDSANTDIWAAIGYPNSLGENIMSVHGQSYVMIRSSRTEQLAAWLAIQSLTSTESQIALAENNAYLPLSRTAAQELKAKGSLPTQWFQAADLLENAVSEPRLASWQVVRSIVQDVVAEVVDVRFEPGTISMVVRQLADMAAEYNQ